MLRKENEKIKNGYGRIYYSYLYNLFFLYLKYVTPDLSIPDLINS